MTTGAAGSAGPATRLKPESPNPSPERAPMAMRVQNPTDLPASPRPPAPGAGILAAALLCVAGLTAGATAAPAQSSGEADAGLPADTADPADPSPEAGPAGPPDGSTGRIDGFWGVAWGSDSAAVAGRLGTPITVGRVGEGLRYFVYTPLFLARDGFLQMWLDEEDGLVGASWEPMISDCGDMLRRLVRSTRQAHPEVPSRTEGRMTPEMLDGDLCMAALEKGAAVTVVWEDAAGTELRVGTTPGSHKLRMRALTEALRARRPEGI